MINTLTLENSLTAATAASMNGYRLRVRQEYEEGAGELMKKYLAAFGSIAQIVSGWDTPVTTWATKCRAIMDPDEYTYLWHLPEKVKEIFARVMARFYWLEGADMRAIDLPLYMIERRVRRGMEI